MTDSNIKWNNDIFKNGATFLIIISILLFSFRFSCIKEEKRKKRHKKEKHKRNKDTSEKRLKIRNKYRNEKYKQIKTKKYKNILKWK